MRRMLFPIIKKYLKLLISIMLVSAMGCSIMTGLSSAYVSLEGSLNDYVTDYNYPDAVITTDITNRKNVSKLTAFDSVSKVNARLFGDSYIQSKEGRYLSVRFFTFNSDDEQKFHFWSKKDSGNKDFIYLEYNYAKDNNVTAGDTISFRLDQEYRDYFVAGIVSMPETLSVQPTDDAFGSNADFGYAYAPLSLLNKEYELWYEKESDELEKRQSELDKKLNDAKSTLSQSKSKLDEDKELLSEKQAQLLETYDETESEKLQSEIDKLENTVNEEKEKYQKDRDQILSSLENEQEELEDDRNDLENSESYDVLCDQFLIYFNEGADKKSELEKLKNVLEHDKISVLSSFTYEDSAVKKRIDVNLEPIETMSIFMPMIFFIIILIVVFMFMSLIIKQSRREIGILRALGFSKTSIKLTFCGVNLIVSVFSILLGTLVGYLLMRYVGDYYTAFFPLPDFTYSFNSGMYILSAVLTIITGQISTLISTGTISRILPSEAMSRPAPETAELPRLVEKITAGTSPMTKFSITTMLRNKGRFIFSVICISASVMMIFSSLAFITSKNYLLHQLYDERINYDCQIFFKEDPTDEFIKELNDLEFVTQVHRLPYYKADISYGKNSKSAVINAIDSNNDLVGVYDLNDTKLDIPESGIVLERHLAQELGAGKGDTVKIDGKEFKIAELSDQCISRVQYVSTETAKKLGDSTFGSVICKISEKDEQKLQEFLTKNNSYLYSVFTRLSYQSNEKIFKTYDLAAWIIIGFAIVIGLVIVINTAQTNLLEKKRELCVLRTLGFRHGEISLKWFVQSIFQFVFSCLIGLPSGVYIAKTALFRLSTEGREYVFANSFSEYVFTVLLVLLYIIVSHFIAMNSMKRWDLVESVKDKE